ncbi:hypothetical protein TeGR_g9589 [Tetraparma gracilis]|uniref:SLC41A/MgtE integral membrane domain-containing protein n=1 Tax=Tetraparma gracilis TaxID=2962635 RepID=A0ABQ6N4H5_9STRA|nr:hypothetical protein TeGR_g9589 [Tetraparma gracilis]
MHHRRLGSTAGDLESPDRAQSVPELLLKIGALEAEVSRLKAPAKRAQPGGVLETLYCSDDDGCSVVVKTESESLVERGAWLSGLLLAQSFSGLILASNEVLLQNHPAIIFFLTMLVGAGGNAGNQASVRVIRGLAVGSITAKNQGRMIRRELTAAIVLSSCLSVIGFLRCVLFKTPMPETAAITFSLFLVVIISVVLGACLPLGLKKIGVDPAHSSTSIQVIMDVLGVYITVVASTALLDSPWGHMMVARLGM